MENNKKPFYSPLRYPGGKTKIAPFIKALFYENGLVGINYVEPYAGGAGVALTLLFEEYVATVTINDYDRSIYAFWHSIVNKPDEFCEKIRETPVNIRSWKTQKEIQKNKDSENLFLLGFSTFFLNRTNISGIIKGGVIGGKYQTGKYKIDARYSKENLIKKIQHISAYKSRIIVTNKDALNLISENLSDVFVYLDPPYVNAGKYLYMDFYKKEDHMNIAKSLLVNTYDFLWMLSYDSHDLIKQLYGSCKNKISWSFGYGLSNRKNKEEIIFHPKLKFAKSKVKL